MPPAASWAVRSSCIFEDEEANPAVAVQKADKLFQVGKVDFLTGTVNSGSTLAVGQLAERAGKLIATTVSFADSITGDKCSPNVFRVNARAGQQSAALAVWLSKEKPKAKVFYLGPDYEMGRSTVAAFKSSAEKVGASTVGEVFAPLDSKDYTQYFGQLRAARPQVLYTSVAGNDTVRLFTQLQEFGLLNNLTVVGASGTVTSQNIAAIGKAAEGFVTGVGYSTEIDSPENKKFVDAFQAAIQGRARPLRRRLLRPDLCLQGRGGEGQVDRDRQGARGAARAEMDDAAGREDHPRRRPSGDPDHVRRSHHQRPVQDRWPGRRRGCDRPGRLHALLSV